jgi:hypothetical protein
VKSDQEGSVAPPAPEDSWISARTTNEIIAEYSTTIKAVCSHTDGRMPRIERYTRTPMMAVATSQVTGLENVCVGNSTNSRYAPARVMLPTLANVDTATLRNPVPAPTDGEIASPTQTYGAPACARHLLRLA